jgi:DNA-binding response OmpR family regulator
MTRRLETRAAPGFDAAVEEDGEEALRPAAESDPALAVLDGT